MRSYLHLFLTGDRCEAPGCTVSTFLLWPTPKGHVCRACTPAHAAAAEAALAANDHAEGE